MHITGSRNESPAPHNVCYFFIECVIVGTAFYVRLAMAVLAIMVANAASAIRDERGRQSWLVQSKLIFSQRKGWGGRAQWRSLGEISPLGRKAQAKQFQQNMVHVATSAIPAHRAPYDDVSCPLFFCLSQSPPPRGPFCRCTLNVNLPACLCLIIFGAMRALFSNGRVSFENASPL
ncbi:hypothetical protein LZ32DRAFT_358728 [Colletotrichum eremochloae]|nr:hypothetical protein LZ32DRAFT_358728 [Colletotrichum eremochloae]